MDRYFAQTPVDVRAVMVQREKDQREKEQREKDQREKDQREKDQREKEEKERQERERQEREVGAERMEVGEGVDGEAEKKGKGGGTFSDDESDGSCDAKMGEEGQEEGGD